MNLKPALRILLAAILLQAAVAQAQLPPTVREAVREAGIAEGNVSLWAAPAGNGPPVWQHNAAQAMNPASAIKLLTTYAALDRLGPAHAWLTEAWAHGPLIGGRLEGDLYLRGGGDPALTWDRLAVWLRELSARGLTEITGDLVIDRSLFASDGATRDFDDQPLRPYNATPDALLVNFKSLSVLLRPGAPAAPVEAVALTPAEPFTLINTLVTTEGPCANWREALNTSLDLDERGIVLTLRGTLAASCGERALHVQVQDGPRLVGALFARLWREQGGRWQGRVREARVPSDAVLLSTWRSPPLGELVRDVNKFSNNVMARQLYLALGAPASPRSRQASGEALREWLGLRRIDLPGLVLDNGSGLSRHERITAEGLGLLLRHAWQSPRMPEFLASLPVAGFDGTARRRFAASPVAGRAYLKSGTLSDVMSMAGYVLDAQGRWQVFVMMINDAQAARAEAAIAAAVEALAAYPIP